MSPYRTSAMISKEEFSMNLSSTLSLRTAVLALAVLFCFAFATPMQATPINPPAPGTQTPDFFADCVGCTLVASMAPQTQLSSNGNWQAILTTSVFNDPGNSFGGGLDFFYQIKNVSPCGACTAGPNDIARFTAISFLPSQIPGGLLVDIGINVGSVPGYDPAGTATPGTVDRVPPGDVIGWSFASSAPLAVALTPGSTSIILEIQTNATNYNLGHSAALDGGSANFLSFEPAAPATTPEPASMFLIGGGMLALAGLRRFRRS
jgi:hypothetical protein